MANEFFVAPRAFRVDIGARGFTEKALGLGYPHQSHDAASFCEIVAESDAKIMPVRRGVLHCRLLPNALQRSANLHTEVLPNVQRVFLGFDAGIQ
jgi:hypothetical protein